MKNLLTRRNFLSQTALSLSGLMLSQCTLWDSKTSVSGKIVNQNASLGHLIRDKHLFGTPAQTIHTDVLIVGGGISGLSAARFLQKNNISDFRLLELETNAGGNAQYGENQTSAYPWGAHYLTLPNTGLTELYAFLEECNVITGYDKEGLPVYNEFYLCFDPEERLYINHYWQKGLIPHFGLSGDEQQEIQRFLAMMETYRYAKGKDDKFAFEIPVDNSSQDEIYLELDKISMEQFLKQHHFKSEPLHWYVTYCCRDDYGTNLQNTSAWAGIHYFACRRTKAANADPHDVLTWSEGNGWLVKQFKQQLQKHIEPNKMAYAIQTNEADVWVDVYDAQTEQTLRYITPKCILATPQFINQYILKNVSNRDVSSFQYAPWMTANITTRQLPNRRGVPLSWDNVIYGSPSLGYVNATHQQIKLHQPKTVLTYYLPLTDEVPKTARLSAYNKKHEDWTNYILKDLSKIHPQMESYVENIDVRIWGHGMIAPHPGFIWGEARRKAQQSFQNRLFFAHSDLSGISVFEEAFYQGIKAAKQVLEL